MRGHRVEWAARVREPAKSVRGQNTVLLSRPPVDAEEIGSITLLDDATQLLLLGSVDVVVIAEFLACSTQHVDGLDVREPDVTLGPLLELKRSDFVPGRG